MAVPRQCAAFVAIGAGQSTEIMGRGSWQTEPSADFDLPLNYGFVEVTGSGTCQAKVTVGTAAGAVLGTKTYARRQSETPRVYRAFPRCRPRTCG